jgi:hypothetical protein
MIDLIIVACLLASPAECRDHIVTDVGSVPTCQFSSMLTVAKWAGDHPRWQVKRFQCREFERES